MVAGAGSRGGRCKRREEGGELERRRKGGRGRERISSRHVASVTKRRSDSRRVAPPWEPQADKYSGGLTT